MTEILENIRRVREEKKISQADLGFHLGLEQSSYSQVESGNRKLSLARLLLIAQKLDVPVEELLGSQVTNYQISESLRQAAEDAPSYSPTVRLVLLQKENELLKQQIEDQKKIIKLLEEKCP